MAFADLCWRALKATFVVAPKRTALAIGVLACIVGLVVMAMLPHRVAWRPCEERAELWVPNRRVELAYEFLDVDRPKLERARGVLESRGYVFVSYDKGPCSDCPTQTLRMKKTDSFTPASFCARDRDLYVFAHSMGLEAFWAAVPTDPDTYENWADSVH